MGRKTKIAKNFSKFIFTNVLGTAVDTAVLWFFSTYVFSTYFGDYVLSPLISFEFAVTSNYICSYFFVWSDRVRDRRKRVFFKKYLVYNASSSMVFLLKMGFLLLIEVCFGWNVVWCNLAALCVSGAVNFVLGEWFIFRNKVTNRI